MIFTGRRRLFRHALVLAGVVAAGTLAPPHAAQAYTANSTANCSTIAWEAPPQYVIHMTEFWASGGDADELVDLFQAVYDINVQLNQVGHTTAEVLLTGNTGSISPFEAGVWFNDAAPTLHIGFTTDPTDISGGADAAAHTGPVSTATCTYDEAHIVFKGMDDLDWNFGTPQDSGEDYWTAGASDADGDRWFRQTYMHELIHTFGLSHSDDTYAFTNGSDRPWANRDGADSIRPLPDDIRGLRDLYPGTGSRAEVAVLNSWFDPNVVTSGAAHQFLNCAPSLGDARSADFDAPVCGVGGPDSGSTDVCPTDTLHVRFTVANYSNRDVNLTARIYLSLDEEYTNTDAVSVTSRPIAVPNAHSDHFPRTYRVPNPATTDADYYVIARVTGTTSNGVAVEDWIPLTGKVHIQPSNLC